MENSNYELEKCKTHRQANRLGKPLQGLEECQCCNSPIHRQALRCDFNLEEICYLGSGLVLYFHTLRWLILIFLLMSFCFSLPMILVNQHGTACQTIQSLHCSRAFFVKLSAIGAIQNQQGIHLQSYISIGLIIVIFIGNQVYIVIRKRTIVSCSITSPQPQDYSVLCILPHKQYCENTLLAELQKWWMVQLENNFQKVKAQMPQLMDLITSVVNKQSIRVAASNEKIIQSVVPSYDLTSASQFNERISQIQQQLKQKKLPQDDRNTIFKQMLTLKAKLANVNNFSKNTKCIIIFRFRKMAAYFFKRNNPPLLKKIFKDCNHLMYDSKECQVRSAPSPVEVKWSNHSIPKTRKIIFRVNSWLLTLVMLFIGEGFIVLLVYLWFTFVKNYGKTIEQGFSTIVSLAISMVSFLLSEILCFISTYQHQPTAPDQEFSKIKKVVIVVFLNEGLLLFIAYYVFGAKQIWEYNGFIDTMSYSFFFNMALPHISKYFNYKVIRSLYNCYMIDHQKIQLTQNEANNLYIKVSHQVYMQYAWLIHMVFWTFFFSPLIPLGFVTSLISLLIQYYLQKVNVIYLYCEPSPSGSDLNQKMLSLISYSSIFLVLSNLSIQVVAIEALRHQASFGPIFLNCLVLFLTFLIPFLPENFVSKYLPIGENELKSEEEYNNVKGQFRVKYQQSNPIFKPSQQPVHRPDKLDNEMREISMSLKTSLQERLLNNNNQVNRRTILHFLPQEQLEEHLYFQYERKVNMPKQKNRGVQPIFRKPSEDIERAQTSQEQPLVRLSEIFQEGKSDGERNQRLKNEFKRQIKKQIKRIN